jgi:hypothetical protein
MVMDVIHYVILRSALAVQEDGIIGLILAMKYVGMEEISDIIYVMMEITLMEMVAAQLAFLNKDGSALEELNILLTSVKKFVEMV